MWLRDINPRPLGGHVTFKPAGGENRGGGGGGSFFFFFFLLARLSSGAGWRQCFRVTPRLEDHAGGRCRRPSRLIRELLTLSSGNSRRPFAVKKKKWRNDVLEEGRNGMIKGIVRLKLIFFFFRPFTTHSLAEGGSIHVITPELYGQTLPPCKNPPVVAINTGVAWKTQAQLNMTWVICPLRIPQHRKTF